MAEPYVEPTPKELALASELLRAHYAATKDEWPRRRIGNEDDILKFGRVLAWYRAHPELLPDA